jgi:hypothetical protein
VLDAPELARHITAWRLDRAERRTQTLTEKLS